MLSSDIPIEVFIGSKVDFPPIDKFERSEVQLRIVVQHCSGGMKVPIPHASGFFSRGQRRAPKRLE